ncbi:EF-hand calcium-binding domain-containing protein 4B [Pimephales promelas]|nr:EF-hand calcium-binding domain-containing protein 4B [Pimephales promelas]
MSGRRSKKNQRLGSSRRGPKGLNRKIEKDDEEDDGFQQIAESGDGQNEFHTLTDYHSAQFDLPPSSSIEQQTSVLECPPHARSQNDSLIETELPERKRKMGSTRKSAGGFKVERKLEVRTTEDLDEYVTQSNTSASEEQNPSLTEDEQSSSSSFSSNLSLQAESSGLGGEPRASVKVVVSENEEEDAIHHQEITSHSYEVVSDTPIDKAMGESVNSAAATVAERDLLQEDSVMFNELKTLSRQETPSACTSGQKTKIGSTRRPLGGKNSENVGLQEHSRSMTENERKAEVIDEAKFSMSEEMVQMWDDVARDDPSSYTESSLVSNQSLLAKRAELNKPDVSVGTETMNQSVVFPLVDPEKSLPETSSHHGTLLLNKGLDFKFGSNTEDFDVPNKVLEEAGNNLSDDNQHVTDTRNYTNTSHNCRDVNTVEGEEVLKQKEEPSTNNKMSSLSPGQDAHLEELVLNSEKSPSLSQNDNFDHSTAQRIDGGNSSFDVPASNISHAKLTTTNSPHEMSDAVEQSHKIYVEMKHENDVSDVASMTCDSLTELECDERGPVQGDARDHIVTQIIMEVTNIKEDGGESTETILISNQKPCEDSTAKEELHREQEQDYSSTISRTQSGPPQDNAGKMLENEEVREDKEETGTTVINDVTSKSEEMLSFEDSATETGSHENQQLFMQSHAKYDLSESGSEETEKQVTFFSAESENAAFDKSVGRSEETEGIEGMDAAVLILELKKPLTNVCTVFNDSKSDLQIEHPEQNKILTEEQNDTSPDINLEAFQISDKICTEIDSSVILQVAVSSEETDSVNEESDISPVIPEDSQDSYKLPTFHSETQENEGDTDILPVGGDTDLEIQTQSKTFYSSTSEAVRTEEKVREFEVDGDTVTGKSNRNSIQTSSEALKVSESPENEVSSEINIILEDTHRGEVHTQSSPVVYKRKMGSTRRPLKGNKGQRKGMKYHDEDETLDSEATMNVEKETFNLEDEPSPDKSTSQSSKDGAKEQEMEICEKNDVVSVEGSESALEQSSFSLDSVSEESTAVTISHITESQTLTEINVQSQENTGDAERGTAEGGTESHSEIQTEIKPTDLTTSEAERTEDSIRHATVLVEEVEFIVDTVTVEGNMTESDLLQNDTVTVENLETLKVSENIENVSFVTDTGLLVQGDATEGSGKTNTIPDKSDTNTIPENTHREEAHSKSSPVVQRRKMGSTRRPLKGNKGQRKGMKYHDEDETLDSEATMNVEKETFNLEDEPSPDKSTSQSSKDGAKEQEMEICEKNDVGSVEGSESALEQSSFSLDSVSEESTAVTISHITESQTLTEINVESQENTGDAERGTAEGVEEVEFIVDSVTVESNKSDLLQNDTVTVVNMETCKVSENIENVSFVTDTGLLVQDDATEGSGETNTIPDQSDTNTIPEDTHREEAHSKSSPIVQRRKMGSTRRPLKGNKGQRKGMKYHDENETLDSEATMNVEKETFSLEDEPSPDKSTSQSSKDGAKEQEMEICEKNDVGSVEGTESALIQSSFSLDSVSEESTAVTISHITESQTLTEINVESQENTGDAERGPAEGGTESHSEIQTETKPTDLTTSAEERTEENISEATVLVEEVEFIVDSVTVESNKSDLLQNDTVTVVNMETFKVSENIEIVSSVTDTGLLVQDDATETSGETNTIPDQSDTNTIPEDTHREEAHSKSSLIVQRRKMGSTRRPLKGNKGQRKGMKYHDEDETLDSEATMNVEKETFSLEDEPSPDKSTSQSSKDGAKEQEMEICEKNDVGSVEGSESALEQSSFSLDSVSEESTAVTISHITESQTLTEINIVSQENTGDAERGPAEGGTESHSEILTENKSTDLTTSAEERTEENICEATVLVEEVEFIVDSVTVESNKSDLLQNDTVTVVNMETFKVSENIEIVSSVTDTGLLVQGDVTEGSGKTNTIPDQSDTNTIPEDTHREEAHSKPSPIVHKRKMGSTRRPLKGNKGQRKGMKYHDEDETLDSEATMNVEKETFSLEDEPSPDKSTSQSSKDGAKEQEMEICEKNDVVSVEGSESALEQSSFSLDSVSEESTAVTISHITESQTLTEINVQSQENVEDAERGTAEGGTESHSEIQTEIKPTDLTTSEAERTEDSIRHATVLVEEVEFIVDSVTVESNKSDLLQNDTVTVENLETFKVSENIENVSFVTDTGLLVQDDATEGSGETNTIPDQSDTNTIPEDTHREEAHSKSSPIVQRRKMGSTRRPLKGNKGQRKGMKYHDEDETLDSEATMNVEKETFNLENEPSPDKSTSQSSKDGAKEQEMEICEKNDVGSVEGSESALDQSSFSLDSVSEESTAVTISHITESQTLTEINVQSQENTGDAERGPAEGGRESHSEIKPTDLTTSAAERTEENICEATVLVEEVEFIVDSVTVESNKSDLLQNDTVTVVNMETFKVSENIENVSSVTDTGLLVQGDVTEGSGKTNTIPDQSDTNTIPEDTHREEAHSKSSPIVHKRKMGSTRRPLKGNKGQRKGMKYHDEDETLDSEATMNVEKETFNLEDEPSPDISTSQSSKDGAKEQEMEICEKNDVGSVEGSESALEQSSFSLDSVSEESTAVTISHITESQTLTEINVQSQENTGDAERGPAEGGTESHSEIQTETKPTDLTTSAEERTEENISEATVLVEEVEFIVDSVTVESNKSDLLQNDTVTVVNMETFKVSENIENVSSVTDTGLLVQDDATEASGETNTIPDQSDTNTIPEDTHREEAHSKSSPIVQRRKMGSTRRPLKGNKGQRKGMKYHDEDETLDSEATMNVEKETFNLEDEPSPDKSTSQSSKDGAKEQEMEICEKNDVGSVEGSESALEQSSFSLDSVSEESTAVTISHITESQTLTEINVQSQENTGDAERGTAEGGTESHSEILTENKSTDLTTSAEERTEENICEATVLVEEVEFIVDSVTVESNKSDLLQNDTVTVVNMETFKVSENIEIVSSVTDTGLLVQGDVTEGSGKTNTIPDQSDTNTIPEDTHREEAHSKSSPIVHKRKMGSTRRPLKGNKGQRKGMKYHDENETLDSEATMNVEKETFNLEDEPSPDKSTSQSSKDGAKEQEMEICEKNDVGSVEGSESALEQSSFSLDSVSEESTAVTISHITESQTLTEINVQSQENTGDAERGPAEGGTESHSEIQTETKPTDLTTSEAERTEDSIRHATVLVEEVEFIVDSVTVESNKSDLLQNDTVTVENLETFKVSENIENVSFVTDTGLLVQDDATEGSGETNTIPDQSDTNTIPEDTHREEAHSKPSPIVQRRKMGSTRRPLKGNKGQRKGMKYHDENETLDSEATMNVEQETFSLENEPSPDKSTSQSSKDGAKEQEMEICEKNDVGSVEGSESALEQSSFSLDSVSEESTAVTISHITESQTLTEINVQSQENTGDAERGPAEGGTESHSEIQTETKPTDLTTSAEERTEENISEATVLVEEVEFIVDSVTVESNKSDLLQNDTVTVVNMETFKVSENIETVSSVTDTGLLVQGDVTEGSGKTNTIPDQSDTKTIPEDTHREEAHSKSSPIVHKRKMGSTRRPLKGNKGQRKGMKYHDEDETLDSEATMNVEKETFSLKDEPSPDKSTSQSSKDGAKEQEMEMCEKNDVGSVEGTESALEQSSFSLDSVSEESTAVTISHITESQTLTEMYEESQVTTGDAERVKHENVENKVSRETKTITEPRDINFIPEDSHREEVHTKFSPVVHKQKMGSTRRPLRGNKGQMKVRVEVSGEEETETLSDDLKQEQISVVSQTQTGPVQDDTGSHLLDVPEKTADFARDGLTSHSDLVLSDALLMEQTQIHVSSENVFKSDTRVSPAEVVEMPSVSNRSLQKRKMGSTRKRGKGMVNEDVEEEKEGEAQNTTTDDGTTKSEEKLILEESMTGSLVHQHTFGSSAGKESHDIQDVVSKSDVRTENSEQNDQNQAAEIVLDLPLGDVETYSVPEQSKITSILPEEFHRKDIQSNSITDVKKRKMGSTRKTLRGNKGQRGEVESKTMDAECKGMAKEQDTDPHLAVSKGENKCKLDEQNFPVEFSHQASISNMFSESEDGVKEVSLNIHDTSEVSEEKGMENTVNDSNSLTEAINLYGGTMDKFDLTVSCEYIHQTMSADYPDQHVHGESEPEQTETICQVFPTQVLKNIQDDVVHENSSQKIPSTQEKRRKISSTRKNPRVMHGKNMGDQYDIHGMAMDGGAKKAENDLDDMPLASNMSQPKEMSPEAVSAIDIESEMLVSDLKGGENDYQNNSDPTRTTGHETPENTEDQLVSVDVTKHLQPKTVPVEKRRKMGSTRKNVREGRIRGKRDVYEDTETAETHLQMSQDSEMSLVGKAVGEQTIHNYSDQSEGSLLSEIERALNNTSQSSSIHELIVPNSDDLVSTSHLNKPENSEIKSLQPKPSQSSETHSEPNSPERRRRKMGSTRKNPRQEIKAEREDEDKEDGEMEGNLEANKQEMKNLEIVATSVVHNIPENKLNKEYLDVPSAHTSSSQLEESSNSIVQERSSPSTKRKFGSRRTNKGKQGLGRLDASDCKSELGDDVDDNLRNDLPICDTHLCLQPENQPIFQPISEQSNMDARNEEAATKGTGAGIVCLDQIIKHDRSTGTRQTIHLKNRNSELPFNVVMVGNSCVGKTSFIRRIHEGQFTQDYRSTIGVDTCMQTVELPDRTVKLQIWDTAGQERFHSITTQVFHKADGLLFMYEITCSKSFISVRDWISQARERAPDDAIMILLGNKNDSVERKVQIQEGEDLAREYKIHFMECSAATGDNASESLRTLAELLVERKKRKEKHTTLRREPPPKKSGCC